jgi:hypothetical protein
MMSPTPGGTMAKMTHAMRMELADAIRDRYAAAANKDKSRILEEFIAATGYHEKSAIRVLNASPEPKLRQTRRRPSLYDEAARGALIVLWEASDRVCGKRLKALLPILLPALERNGHLKLEVAIRCKILSMSAATIDRLLRMPRRATRRSAGMRRAMTVAQIGDRSILEVNKGPSLPRTALPSPSHRSAALQHDLVQAQAEEYCRQRRVCSQEFM